ncbi:hypothetical protein ABIF74_006627 [Bradyrhizobium japonicum]
MAQGLVLERFVEERAIEAVLEDRSNRGDGARLDEDAPPAGCVEAFGAVAFDERQNAKAGSKALFWMGPGVDHGLEKRYVEGPIRSPAAITAAGVHLP